MWFNDNTCSKAASWVVIMVARIKCRPPQLQLGLQWWRPRTMDHTGSNPCLARWCSSIRSRGLQPLPTALSTPEVMDGCADTPANDALSCYPARLSWGLTQGLKTKHNTKALVPLEDKGATSEGAELTG